jgi:peptidyl-prolyl cis-trans isomerase SurA
MAQVDSDVLFSVADKPVTVEEFKYIYEKNNGSNADYSEESVTEYLGLYEKFKLKVARARDLQVDTIPALQRELAGYRKQLANTYLNDKEVTKTLVDEVLVRMKTDREVSHIFLPVDQKSSYNIKNQVKANIDAIYNRLKKGEDFAKVAKDASLDASSSVKGGQLGYYVAPLPSGFYAFENAMYDTNIGGYSEPILSKMGYHIIKVHSERPARGKMDIAHILVKKNEKGVADIASKKRVDSLYAELNKEPTQFKMLAAKHSDDKNTAAKGGKLGTIRIRQYNSVFEDAAFALKQNGDYSQPVETDIGWHIIQRIKVVEELDEDRLRRNLTAQLVRDDRLEISKKALIESIKKESNLVVNKRAINTFNSKLTEEFYSYKWQIPTLPSEDLLTFNGGTKVFTLSDFAEYCKRNTKDRLKFNKDIPTVEAVDMLFEEFTDDAVLQYEEANLEKKYPAFKALMREYEEGILLFETTKMEVWDKASQDTVGLQEYYSEHKEDYKWENRVKLQSAVIKTSDSKALAKIQKGIAKNKSFSSLQNKFNSESTTFVIMDPETFTLDSPQLEDVSPVVGFTKTDTKPDGSIVFTKVVESIPAGTKKFNEAKGYIIADYQDYLEQEWVKDLRARYPVEINQSVLDQLIK